MLPSTFVAIILGGWSTFHLVHNFLLSNSYTASITENCFARYNIFITPFQIKCYTQKWNRLIVKLGRVRRLKLWFDLGVMFGLIAMALSVVLLCRTLLTSIQDLPFFRTKSQLASQQVLAVIVPGINLPIKDIGYLLTAVMISAILHELGHAFAAVSDGVKVNGFGIFVFIIYPGAFVDLHSEDLKRVNTRKQLRIYCAGVWHNFIVTILSCGFILLLPFLLSPFYLHTKDGVVVTSHSSDSPLLGEKGLHVGDKIASLGTCSISNTDDWFHCLNMTIHSVQTGSCVSAQKLEALSLKVKDAKKSHKLNSHMDCCGRNPPQTHLCYEYNLENKKEYACLPGRIIMSGIQCTQHSTCMKESKPHKKTSFCVVPHLEHPSKFISIMATEANLSARKHVLYIGNPLDLLMFFSVSNYEGRFWWTPLKFPAIALKFLQYMFSMSGALALLNIVPCYALDGQWAFQTLLNHLVEPQRQTTKDVICKVVLSMGTLLVVANVLFGFAHIFLK